MTVSDTRRGLNILADILAWSGDLPGWQKDALRRIVENGETGTDDVAELTLQCKKAAGLEFDEAVPELRPLAAEEVPAGPVSRQKVTLCSLSHPENVNALDKRQELRFATTGLTVLFGYNGSGKSGYGRIFRRACHARKKGEPILPNVLKTRNGNPASAEIIYALDDAEQSPEEWIDGQRAIDALGSVSFFDSDCAAVHVRERNDIAFMPFGLDVLPKLGTACKEVQRRLDREKNKLEAVEPDFLKSTHATGATHVGKLLTSLRHDSDVEEIELLASLSDDELQRLKDLPAQLANDPQKLARELRTRAGRLSALRERLVAAENLLSPEKIGNLKNLAEDADRKSKAAEAAAKMRFSGDPLPEIGEAIWRELWAAARRYSAVAYPDRDFPVIDPENALCVLCQQPLSSEAKNRLRRFENHVADDTAQHAELAKAAIREAIEQLELLGLQNEVLREHLKDVALVDPNTALAVRRALAGLLLRLRAIRNAYKSGNWNFPSPAEIGSIGSDLQSLVESATKQAAKFEKSANAEERKKLDAELAELRAREWLATVFGDVKRQVHRLAEIRKLQNCISETRTNRITAKSKQLAEEHVTDKLRDAFATEVKKMEQGIRRLNVEVTADAGEFGSSYYRIRLIGGQDADIGTIVSEGEHRCIALAGFLSELATEQSQSSIVFDDPVCSLDYLWSERFARRVVEEAASRQVVVFTHDVLFLHDLCSFAEQQGIPIETKQLQAIGDTCGHVGDELPNDLQGLKARLNALEQEQANIRRLYESNGDGYEMRVRNFYDRLRAAIERAVEERVFNGVIFRFRNEVKVGLLPKVAACTRQDAGDLHKLHIQCSENITGHDRAALRGGIRLTPGDLKADLDELQRIVTDINLRQNGIK